MTRRLRTVTKIFKNMYLSGRTAVQFQFQSPDPAARSPRAAPKLAAPRYIYFAFPSCRGTGTGRRSKGCYCLAFPVQLAPPRLSTLPYLFCPCSYPVYREACAKCAPPTPFEQQSVLNLRKDLSITFMV